MGASVTSMYKEIKINPRMHMGITEIPVCIRGSHGTNPQMHMGICAIPVCIRGFFSHKPYAYGKYFHTGNQVLYPHLRNFAYWDCRVHMGIPVCKRAGTAKKIAYGDPITHNEVVRTQGLTYTPMPPLNSYEQLSLRTIGLLRSSFGNSLACNPNTPFPN